MGRDIIARGMASGAIKVNINAGHIFVDNTARDAYFVTNPSELVENMYVYCNSKLQQYDGSIWIDRTPTIKGETGTGVPTGGTTNQVLTKNSNGDYDFSWVDLSGGGDMDKSFYDTANKQVDVYDMDNMEDGTTYVRTENNFTNDYKNKIDDTSGTNTGDETTTTIISKIGYTPENTLNKGVNNGYCGLDSGGKVPLQNLPSTLLKYIGTWNAETNIPNLNATDLTKVSHVYVVSHDGTQFGIIWKAGDWLIYDVDGIVEKSDNSDDVVSVNGKTGIVIINKADVGLSNVDNTSDLDKPISNLTQTALNLKANDLALTTHTTNTSNPHGVTKSQVGLSNVINVNTTTTTNITDSTNKRFITDVQRTLLNNTSGSNTGDENTASIKSKLGVSSTTTDGYLTKEDFIIFNNKANIGEVTPISHTTNTSNPHGVTKTQVGLDNVVNIDTTTTANITDTTTKRFVTDTEKTNWDNILTNDTNLSLKNYNKLNLNWEIGAVSEFTGGKISSNKNIISDMFIQVISGEPCLLKKESELIEYKIFKLLYTKAYSTQYLNLISKTEYLELKEYELKESGLYRLVLHYKDNRIITEINDDLLIIYQQKTDKKGEYDKLLDCVNGYAMQYQDSYLYLDSEFFTTPFIEVEENTKYKGLFLRNTCFFDENYDFISGVITTSIPFHTVTTPINCKYVRYTARYTDDNSDTAYFRKVTDYYKQERKGLNVAIIGDSISTSYNKNAVEITITSMDAGVSLNAWLTNYDVPISLGGINYTTADIGTKITFTPILDDVGKTIGKPLNYNTATTITWWENVANYYNWNVNAVCWSGSSYSSHEANLDILKTSHAWHESTIRKCGTRTEGTNTRVAPDVIILYRGTNDFSHTPYALLTDNYFDAYNWAYPTTDDLGGDNYGFKQAISLTIKNLRTAYPNAKIVLCTLNVFKRINYTNFPTNNGINSIPQYNKAIRECAEFFGCGLIEFDKSGITFENLYTNNYVTDSATIPTHPNNLGYDIMAQKAIRDLEQIYK